MKFQALILKNWLTIWRTHSRPLCRVGCFIGRYTVRNHRFDFFLSKIYIQFWRHYRPQVEVTFKLHILMEFIITCQTVFYSFGWYQIYKSTWFSNMVKQNHISTHAENHIDIYVPGTVKYHLSSEYSSNKIVIGTETIFE